jgi:hypothetical protein
LNLGIVNSYLGYGVGSNTTQRFVGIPSLSRYDVGAWGGVISSLTYAPSLASFASVIGTNYKADASFAQCLGDCNIGQLWQYGIKASALLYSDTTYAALPNATTLYAGQVLAPPAYWNGANGKRYALDVVYQSGTTGTPNAGGTTCLTQWGVTAYSITSNVLTVIANNNVVQGQVVRLNMPTSTFLNGANLIVLGTGLSTTQFTAVFVYSNVSLTNELGIVTAYHNYVCSSATDLSVGQAIKVGTDATAYISMIDSTNASQVLLVTNISTGAFSTPTALGFAAPVLGPEIQLPTKSSAAPTTLAWSQGDTLQNSGAATNGICGWVNVAAGTPGTWTAIPCANGSGQLVPSQISGTMSTSQIGTGTPGAGKYVDGGTGAWTALPSSGGSTVRVAYGGCSGIATSSATLVLWGLGGYSNMTCTNSQNANDVLGLLMPSSGTLSNLTVRCNTTGVNSSSGVFRILDTPSGTAFGGGGTATGLTVTYGTTAAGTTIYDNTNTYAYSKGDYVIVTFTTQASETLGGCTVSFNY